MKKFLLSIFAIAIGAAAAVANEYTLVFDGENDMYGLPRQSATKADYLTFVSEFSFTEAGIDFSIKKASDAGNGFALVNAGGTNAGLMVYSSGMSASSFTIPDVTLSVPNGKITAVKVFMSGTSMASLDLTFNGELIEAENKDLLYYWTWKSAEGVEKVSFTWPNNYYSRYIHSIEVTYSEDLGGKKECGLAFSEKEAEGVLGEDFTAPQLSNPNNLPLVWESSDEQVATVDAQGKVTLVGKGQTVINVSTGGNEEFAAGNARYDLTVIPAATNLVKMLEVAPEVLDRVMVNFPMTVMYANGPSAFVVDPDGNAGYIQDIRNAGSTSTTVVTIYKVGNVIPAGWVATNATMYGSVVWQGIGPAVTETVTVEYPVVETVTREDADKVVILKDVTFTTTTASGNTKAFGTTPDGTTYEFQDTYGLPSKGAGTYDVTCIVRYSKVGSSEYFYLSPIAYAKSESSLELIEATGSEALYYDLHGSEVKAPKNGVYVKVADGKASKVLVK